MQADKMPIWKAIWLGIKIALILIPTLLSFSYIILGHKLW